VRFEINRTVSGMGHEVFRSVAEADAAGDAPAADVARRIFAVGGVEAVHIYSNVITVHLGERANAGAIKDAIENMYIFYGEGVEVVVPE
jgi:hypothetical protein